MNNKLVTILVGTTVAVICLAAILMPVLQDEINGTELPQSNGDLYAKFDTADHVIDCDNGVVTIDGSPALNTLRFYVVSQSFSLWRSGSTLFLESYPTTNITTEHYTLTISNGSVTINNGTEDTATFDCPGIWVPSLTKTDHVFNNGTPYLNSSEDLTFSSIPTQGYYYVNGGKVYKDGVLTEDTIEITTTDIEDVSKAYVLSSLAIKEGDTEITSSGLVYIVPASINGIVPGSDEGPMVSILSAIPVIIIAAILVGVVATFTRKN